MALTLIAKTSVLGIAQTRLGNFSVFDYNDYDCYTRNKKSYSNIFAGIWKPKK